MQADFSKYNDIELFAALKSKKQAAEASFAELYSRYSQRVFAYCLRITGSHDDAKDIFQETFLKFYQSAQGAKLIDNVPGFLLTIARNLCLNYKRDQKSNLRIEDFVLTANDRGYDQKEMMQVISSALELLEFEHREAFILRQYHGLDYNEIALITGDTVTAVKNRVWRAKEKLKEILTPYLEEVPN